MRSLKVSLPCGVSVYELSDRSRASKARVGKQSHAEISEEQLKKIRMAGLDTKDSLFSIVSSPARTAYLLQGGSSDARTALQKSLRAFSSMISADVSTAGLGAASAVSIAVAEFVASHMRFMISSNSSIASSSGRGIVKVSV